MLQIREAQQQDEASWRNLWAGYLAFYKVVVSEEVTARTWARILDPDSSIFGSAAMLDGRLAGFAIYVIHEATWNIQPMNIIRRANCMTNLRWRMRLCGIA